MAEEKAVVILDPKSELHFKGESAAKGGKGDVEMSGRPILVNQ